MNLQMQLCLIVPRLERHYLLFQKCVLSKPYALNIQLSKRGSKNLKARRLSKGRKLLQEYGVLKKNKRWLPQTA